MLVTKSRPSGAKVRLSSPVGAVAMRVLRHVVRVDPEDLAGRVVDRVELALRIEVRGGRGSNPSATTSSVFRSTSRHTTCARNQSGPHRRPSGPKSSRSGRRGLFDQARLRLARAIDLVERIALEDLGPERRPRPSRAREFMPAARARGRGSRRRGACAQRAVHEAGEVERSVGANSRSSAMPSGAE